MALYGLCVFLETPEHFRTGRKRYIATSIIITVLSILSGSLDMANHFQVLLELNSGRHWLELARQSQSKWGQRLSSAAIGCLLLIADALLVSIVSRFLIVR